MSTSRNARPEATAERTRNRHGEGGKLRQDIVDATLEILDASGESGAVTLRAIARHAGISAPSISPHFGNRQAILPAALHHASTDVRKNLDGRVDAAGHDSVDRLSRDRTSPPGGHAPR